MLMKGNLNSHKKTSVSVGQREMCLKAQGWRQGVSEIAGALEIVATSVGGHFSWLLVSQNMLSVP